MAVLRPTPGERQRVFSVKCSRRTRTGYSSSETSFSTPKLGSTRKRHEFHRRSRRGATFVIISGGIDLFGGRNLRLASVVGGSRLPNLRSGRASQHHFTLGSVPSGFLFALEPRPFCGLLNGGMIVALRCILSYHTGHNGDLSGDCICHYERPIDRRIFHQPFAILVRWEVGEGLSLVPLGIMLV